MFHNSTLLLGHVMDVIGERNPMMAGTISEKTGAEFVNHGSALMFGLPCQCAVGERLGKDDGVSGSDVYLFNMILVLPKINHAFRAAQIGLVAAGDDCQTAVPRSFVCEHKLDNRQSGVDAAVLEEIRFKQVGPLDTAAVQIRIRCAFIHGNQPGAVIKSITFAEN